MIARKKTIKPTLRNIRKKLEEIRNQLSDLINDLDLDPVAGNNPRRNSKLDIDLNSLSEQLDEANQTVNKVIYYQPSSGITYQPRKP